jgi:iron complex outermembrane receptor protein
MNMTHSLRAYLVASTAVGAAIMLPQAAMAQGAASPQASAAESADNSLQEIVVTAQKREQNLQDVPIAITALTPASIEANRVTTVNDLSSLAPGLTVREAVGGARLPSFSMRGALSLGVTPGSDKQVSTYIDGVYLSAGRGGIFDLPDVESIEVLRGPQGTLFGRNATGGAISVRTRDPKGKFAVKVTGTIANQDEKGVKITVDTPQVGAFSAYASYARKYRHGDIRNLGVVQTFDRTASANPTVAGIEKSAPYLGTEDSHSFFAAVKFESGDFKTVYKFDYNKDHYSAQGNAAVGINAAFPGVGPFIAKIVADNNAVIASDGKRPDGVNNSWVVPGLGRAYGHSLVSSLIASDQITFKNIFAARKTQNFAVSAVDGLAALPVTAGSAPLFRLPQSAVGQPFVGVGTQGDYTSKQYSDELQATYQSSFLTATVGGIWFQDIDDEGTSLLSPSTRFAVVTNGVLTTANIGHAHNKIKSLAGYSQLEFHVLPKLDVVLGGRVTNDKKSGFFDSGTTPAAAIAARIPFAVSDTRFTYLAGVNYKPTDDMLLYGKFSTGFVSGGSAAGIPFTAETAKSFELGAKAEFFDRKLRTNISIYHVTYDNVQFTATASSFLALITQLTGDPTRASKIQSFIVNPGSPLVAKGVELDVVAAPVHGVTLGGTMGYTDSKYSHPERIRADLLAANGGEFILTSRPKWVGSAFTQYNTNPFFYGGYLSMRVDVNYQSRQQLISNPTVIAAYGGPGLSQSPYAAINGRIALSDLEVSGAKATLALWGKNLTDNRAKASAYDVKFAAIANFISARAYGLDLTIKY